MVGNISDMQALTATRQYMPRSSVKPITPHTATMAAMASTASSRDGETYLRNHVHINRLHAKNTIATMLYCCESTSAAFSPMPCCMKMRVPYCMMKVQQVICAPT